MDESLQNLCGKSGPVSNMVVAKESIVRITVTLNFTGFLGQFIYYIFCDSSYSLCVIVDRLYLYRVADNEPAGKILDCYNSLV